MVTAELALTLPAVVLVLVICLSALSWGVDRVRCVDAARVAVREIARGEDPGRALDDARALAPEGASVEVARGGRDVTVTVTSSPPEVLAFATGETSCFSTARVEPTHDPA